MKHSVLAILFSLQCAASFAQQKPDSEGSLVQWMSIKEALAKVKEQPRPIIMDFYTGWCGWCKVMMRTTYADPQLAAYINQNFYPVKFDAEGKDTVEYLGKIYAPTSMAPTTTHPLAIHLLQGKMMYPTTLFLNNYDKVKNEFQFSTVAAGYLKNPEIEPILIYTLEQVFKNAPFEEFKAMFNKAYYDSTFTDKWKEVKWTLPKQGFTSMPKTKKTMVFVHADFCNACRVMERTSFLDDSSAKYIREKYELVDFDVNYMDTVNFKGTAFANPRTKEVPFHQLVFAMANGNVTLPSLIIFDEKMDMINSVPYYVGPSFIKNIARYFGDDAYKTKSWNDFVAGK